ncbi:uncharacterized protein LOC108607858 isoform X2 [Drosophila busckii]|uniref:uncharacterized protein LOC108607858 isoform X2 n=1 Tax=Drosophila busckii TaxID=30019 RepID=UPI001432A6E4|nr:uncharacterized protein LOC108607858 isoform X2 [Drosophila busckii]
MEESDKSQQNMISNLPLLFANGYPTSLEKITESQLENFIPFMVQCSLGHINLPKKIDCSEPEWWPENAPFGIPLRKPKHFIGNWVEKMKEIVVICYQFHRSLFLLRFCNDLAAYEHASLRFINNYNSTTSLYDRRNNKLLVTFRNENMEHEKICNIEEDVILCDSPEPDSKYDSKSENSELRNAFLLNFCLQTKESDHNLLHHMPRAHLNKDEIIMETSKRNRRFSARRNRAAPSLNRCSFIPISSPAGKKLVISLKQPITLEYISERQDRIDRFCYTPLILKANYKCKPFEKKFGQNVHCTYKKSHEASQHIYAFPRRQFSQRRDTTQNFLFLNSPLIKQCRPISVRLKKLSDSVGEQYSVSNSKLNIRLTRDTSLNSQWRISPSSEVVVDTIDLCSSDDDDQIVSSPKKGNSEVISCISLSKSNTVSKVRSNYSVQNDHLSSYSQLTDDNSLKPLQQSVYIFSNYKTNSVLNRFSESKVNNHNKPLKTTNTFSHSTNSQSFNQENCNLPKNMISVTDWCAHSAITENKDIMQSDSTITFDNLSVVQPFSSSSRIISIDLTS